MKSYASTIGCASSSCRFRRRGFTLIELLAVIAIIRHSSRLAAAWIHEHSTGPDKPLVGTEFQKLTMDSISTRFS